MAEVPTKPGFGPQVGNPIQETMRGEPSRDPPDRAASGTLPPSERYRIGAELGRGGMGRVVEAFDVKLGRTVALKEVLPRAGVSVARRFAREVQLTARLEHPSIVPLYDSGTTPDGRPFYVMRRVSGRPLDQVMAQASGLDDRLTLLPPLLAAIDAVAHAHNRGVIHRDLKPANILVGGLGETVVIDWGLAKVIGEDDDKPGTVVASDSLRTQMGAVFGTPGFMAPEQARGEELDARSDVYALGATLYQLLAGAPPHPGKSASEVIEKTGSRAVTPVDVIAPGAPPDLVAIVGKALAFDPQGRYPDAGALGEDVRRFLAGQLVAAHRYTRRQRLWRFARRQRAPLAVAALATVAVAGLAWFGVHRIIAERDAANVARADAAHQQQLAETARDIAQRQVEQRLVMQARGLVEGNPTHALAVLKQLPETSTEVGDARAVAQAAVVRGAAWTIETGYELTAFAELSPDGKSLLQVQRDGLRVWDLDRRRQVYARSFARYTRAVWVGHRLLLLDTDAPELIDPFTATAEPVAVGAIAHAAATLTGDRVAYLDERGAAYLLDVASRTAHPLWPGHRAGQLALAADGTWIALADKTTVVVLDAGGRELTRQRAAATWLSASRFDQVAYATVDRVAICTLAPQPVWTEVDLGPRPAIPLDLVFRGRELDLRLGGRVMAWNGRQLFERLPLLGSTAGLVEAGRDLVVAAGLDGKLRFASSLVTGELHLPEPLAHLRLLGRAGAPRVVAVGDGRIVGFDLADSLPEPLDGRDRFPVFVDDDTLMLRRSAAGEWQWYDLRTRVVTPFPYAHGIPSVLEVDPGDGRVLIREFAGEPSLFVLRKNTTEVRRIARGKAVWGRLLPRGVVLFGVGDGRVLAARDGEPREVVRLDGVAETGVGTGTMFAAVSSTGELVRGDLAGTGLVRAHVAPGTVGALAIDRAGRVIVAADNRLLLWDTGVVELAKLDKAIARIVPIDDGVLLELADHAIVRAQLASGAQVEPVVSPSSQSPLISADGRLIVAETVNGQVTVVELPTRATWELPGYFGSWRLESISPSTRRFVQRGFEQTAMWTLPLAPPELRGWLDERTNVTLDDRPQRAR